MANKRKSRVQVEAEGKVALRLRLRDMLRGAHGGYIANIDASPIDDAQETPFMLGADTVARWIGAIEQTWPPETVGSAAYAARNLTQFDTLDSATKWLWNLGVRADA